MALLKKIITRYVLIALLISSFGYTVKLHGGENGENCDEIVKLNWWISARKGRKKETMEDRFSVVQESGFFGVYDGHGGEKAAQYVAECLHKNFLKTKDGTIEERLRNAFLTTDENFLNDSEFENNISGTTAVVAVVDANTSELFIAHAGNSRAMMMRDGKILFATKDHTAATPSERKRIEDAGGKVIPHPSSPHGHLRVNGFLIVSRAIGDRGLKEWVISNPDVHKEFFEEGDVLVLACKSLWDIMTNEKVADFMHKKFNELGQKISATGDPVQGAGEEIDDIEVGNGKLIQRVAQALRNNEKNKNNISVLVVKFGSRKTLDNNKKSRNNKLASRIKRLFKSIIANKNIILGLGGGIATIAFCLHRLGYFSSLF